VEQNIQDTSRQYLGSAVAKNGAKINETKFQFIYFRLKKLKLTIEYFKFFDLIFFPSIICFSLKWPFSTFSEVF
jgi:hypothetical protein